MKEIGVIIARFQTPYLHEGHHKLIAYVKERHNKVVIVLGVSPVKGSMRNPLDFPTRERLVKKHYPEITVLPLPDSRRDDVWSENLDKLLNITFNADKFVLYGSRDSFIPYYSGKLPVAEIPSTGDYSATNLREQISDKVMDSDDFRCGIIYAYYNMYPKVYATLDIAVMKDQYTSILLGKRKHEGKWRLLGGFSDPTDENFEIAALRELREECGPIEVSPPVYETSIRVDDWRYRKETDKIITLLFTCTHIFGEPEGQDDIDETRWFKLTELQQMMGKDEVVAEHLPHFNHLVKKYHSNK